MTETFPSAGPLSAATCHWQAPLTFACESGEQIERPVIAFRTWGRLNERGDNAVLVCHALTGSADADAWWPGMIGQGAALDPDHDFIICSNVLGGCYGTCGPLYPAVDGNRFGGVFPRVSIRDMVHLQALLLDHLAVRHLRLVIGPSMGGMQVLEWALLYPNRVGAIAPIGSSARHSAWCIGIGAAQRAAIMADPDWHDGQYAPDAPPAKGLAAARMMAMISYRSWENFESRFGRSEQEDGGFAVESYLGYQGRKLVDRFDAVSYVRLTEAMDTHDVGRGRVSTDAALASIQCPALVVSVDSDVLYPPREQEYLAASMPGGALRRLDTPHGHDGFLMDLAQLSGHVRSFRATHAPAVPRPAA